MIIEGRPTRSGRGVDNGEIKLLVICAQGREEVEYLGHHFGGACLGPIHLVDDNNRSVAVLKRLA